MSTYGYYSVFFPRFQALIAYKLDDPDPDPIELPRDGDVDEEPVEPQPPEE